MIDTPEKKDDLADPHKTLLCYFCGDRFPTVLRKEIARDHIGGLFSCPDCFNHIGTPQFQQWLWDKVNET